MVVLTEDVWGIEVKDMVSWILGLEGDVSKMLKCHWMMGISSALMKKWNKLSFRFLQVTLWTLSMLKHTATRLVKFRLFTWNHPDCSPLAVWCLRRPHCTVWEMSFFFLAPKKTAGGTVLGAEIALRYSGSRWAVRDLLSLLSPALGSYSWGLADRLPLSHPASILQSPFHAVIHNEHPALSGKGDWECVWDTRSRAWIPSPALPCWRLWECKERSKMWDLLTAHWAGLEEATKSWRGELIPRKSLNWHKLSRSAVKPPSPINSFICHCAVLHRLTL